MSAAIALCLSAITILITNLQSQETLKLELLLTEQVPDTFQGKSPKAETKVQNNNIYNAEITERLLWYSVSKDFCCSRQLFTE